MTNKFHHQKKFTANKQQSFIFIFFQKEKLWKSQSYNFQIFNQRKNPGKTNRIKNSSRKTPNKNFGHKPNNKHFVTINTPNKNWVTNLIKASLQTQIEVP